MENYKVSEIYFWFSHFSNFPLYLRSNWRWILKKFWLLIAAPEVLNYEPISLATDMWSVGVLLYVLLTGCSPFGGDTKQETFCNISRCRLDFPDDLFEDVSEDARDLMRKLMIKDPRWVQQHSTIGWFAKFSRWLTTKCASRVIQTLDTGLSSLTVPSSVVSC